MASHDREPVSLPTFLLDLKISDLARIYRKRGLQQDQFYGSAIRMVFEHCSRMKISDLMEEEFLAAKQDVPGEEWRYSARIASIADSLWALRGISGFGELCKRLAKMMDISVAATELYAARLFADAGFDVSFRQQAEKMGEDFDFLASKDGSSVNVEVSNIQTNVYRAKTLENKIDQERRQLPDNGPGMIVLDIPENWFLTCDPGVEPSREMASVAKAYMQSRSGRLNAVLFLHHRYFEHPPHPWRGSTGSLVFAYFIQRNPSPRYPDQCLDAFFDETIPEFELPDTDEPVLTYRQNTPLFDWLDVYWQRSLA